MERGERRGEVETHDTSFISILATLGHCAAGLHRKRGRPDSSATPAMAIDKPNTLPPCLDLPRIFLMATPASAYAMKQALAICPIGLKISSRFCIPIWRRSMNCGNRAAKNNRAFGLKGANMKPSCKWVRGPYRLHCHYRRAHQNA